MQHQAHGRHTRGDFCHGVVAGCQQGGRFSEAVLPYPTSAEDKMGERCRDGFAVPSRSEANERAGVECRGGFTVFGQRPKGTGGRSRHCVAVPSLSGGSRRALPGRYYVTASVWGWPEGAARTVLAVPSLPEVTGRRFREKLTVRTPLVVVQDNPYLTRTLHIGFGESGGYGGGGDSVWFS